MLASDLHLHTTCSDGLLPTGQVVELALKAQLNVIAITDHDTIQGLKGIGTTPGIRVIPGVELSSTWSQRSVHVLGYGVNPESAPLQAYFKELNQERYQRCEKMVQALQGLGLAIEMEELAAGATGTLGRPHVGRMLVEKGYAGDLQEAFAHYLVPGKPGYVRRQPQAPSHVIQVLRESGAVPVLAHPGLLKADEPTLNALLDTWQEAGLMGLEVYHQAHAPFAFYESIARARGLLVTGGSDFHGDSNHEWVGQMLPHWKTVHEDTLKLLEVLE